MSRSGAELKSKSNPGRRRGETCRHAIRGKCLLYSSIFLFTPFGVAAAMPSPGAKAAQPFLAQATAPPAAAPNPGIPAPAASNSDSSAQDLDSLRRKEADYLRAEMESNPALAGSVLAEDYVGIRADGTSTTKAEVLRNLSAHQGSPEPYTIGAADMREYLFGDTACVTYTKIYTLNGRAQSYKENLMHIFTKRKGVWRLQVSSPIPQEKPAETPKR